MRRRTARVRFWGVDPSAGRPILARPGHIFPLRAALRAECGAGGQTEASVDLARWPAGPAGVICEIMTTTAPWGASRSL